MRTSLEAIQRFMDALTAFVEKLHTERRALLWEIWQRKNDIVDGMLRTLDGVHGDRSNS
jgi:hypothetical protein